MSKDNIIDTSEVLTEEDYTEIEDIKEIRKRLISYINIDVLIDTIRDIVDKSEFVDFKNNRSKKFIDKKRPVFYLKINKSCFKSEKYKSKQEFRTEEKEASYYTNIIYSEIIVKITEFINTTIKEDKDNKELKEFIKSTSLFKDLPPKEDEDFYNRLSVISMMFGIRLAIEDKSIITMEMLL